MGNLTKKFKTHYFRIWTKASGYGRPVEKPAKITYTQSHQRMAPKTDRKAGRSEALFVKNN